LNSTEILSKPGFREDLIRWKVGNDLITESKEEEVGEKPVKRETMDSTASSWCFWEGSN